MFVQIYVVFLGYKPNVISTIVDILVVSQYNPGYKPNVISTIVDSKQDLDKVNGYKPNVISTIVDDTYQDATGDRL